MNIAPKSSVSDDKELITNYPYRLCLNGCAMLLFRFSCNLVGLVALGVGLYVYWNSSTYNSGLNNCSIPLIAIGIVVTCLHTCGFWTIHNNENNCFSAVFAIILILLALVLVIMAALTYFVKYEILEVLSETIEKNFQSASKKSSADMKFVDTLQKYRHCCGIEGPTFWESDFSLPKSCCKGYDENTSASCRLTEAYADGCKKKAVQLFAFFITLIIISVLVLAVFEVISAIIVLCSLKRKRNRVTRLQILYSQCGNPIID